jgi:DNA-directed RNA polymerase specialized sigma subunit
MDSILDKILTQKHAEEIREFSPISLVKSLLEAVPERERDVVARRFGLPPNNAVETLEEIGAKLQVTRERVRQITKSSVAHMAKMAEGHEDVQRFASVAEHLLSAFGGAVEANFYIDQLLDFAHITPNSSDWRGARVALQFLLEHILSEVIELRAGTAVLKPVYAVPRIETKLLNEMAETMTKLVNEHGSPLTSEELVEAFLETSLAKEHYDAMIAVPVKVARDFYGSGLAAETPPERAEESRVVLAYAAAVAELAQNIFGEWGNKSWVTVHPRRMNDKIYLILRREKQPLHFMTIAERINAAHFDHKVARAPSVHNELILDKRFVLVGRGLYALKEWGYEPGTVADVIVDILKEGKDLSREEIVDAVLARRLVKKQTIHLALMNSGKFEKNQNGLYSLKNTEQHA